MIKDIPSRDLQQIRDFTLGDYVLNGFWLGMVDGVLDNVTVMFDGGSVCKVIKADPMRLSPVSTSLLEDAHFPYYPGQRVKASSSSVFKNSRWISGSWKASRVEGTVVKVQAASVFVDWFASPSTGDGSNSLGIPSEEQDPKNLKLLSCLAYKKWKLGYSCLLSSTKRHPPLRVSEVSPGSEHGISFKSSDSQINGIDESVSNHVEDMDNESCNEGSAVHCHDSGITYTNLHNLMNPKESVRDVRDEGDWCSTNSNKLESDDDLRSHLDLQETAAKPEGGGKLPCDQPSNDCIGLKETQKLPENPIPDNVSSEFGSCCSSVSVIKENAQESRVSHRKKLRKIVVKRERKTKRNDEAFERALLIASTVTKVSVIWQNGVRQSGIHSRDLIPIDDTGDGEFYPEQYVVEKPSNEDEDISAVKRVGVVKSVDAKERTACVRWLRPVSRPEDPREFDAEELVSVYELDQHPDYDYCYGDTVIRLSPASGVDTSMGGNNDEQLHQSEMEQSFNNMGVIDEPMQQQSEQVHEHGNLSHLGDSSWVGTISGLKDGDIEVTWADGMVSTVGPQAVFIVGRDEDEDSSQDNEDDAGDNISWETVDPDDMDTLENIDEENKDDGLQCDIVQDAAEEKATESAGEDVQGQNGGLSIPLAAIGFVTRLASGLLFGGRKVTDPSETNNTSLDGSTQFEADTSENSIVEFSTDDKPRFEQNGSGLRTLLAEDFGSFKHFDSATSTEDHYFNENAQSINDRKWIKKVQQEWTILEKNLPEAIYVRVYEDRMDLLRAVIVGAYGMPYQDGLFFFDFYLPPEYPQIPPLAYYHSGGLRVNPNLYENGKVCLSLLNTWTGKGNEVWVPSSSSILQVLVSLQGLVLNAKPYFNEAGYDRQVGTTEGEKNSLLYNENSFLLSCKSMLYILRRPPKNFEELVKQHYQKRGSYILKACDAYLKGALVGSQTKDATGSENAAEHESSAGLKFILAKIVPKLLTALKEVGAECHQFEHFAS